MSMRKTLLLLGLLAASAAGAQTPVRFLHEWRFEGHVAPFLVARDKGYFKAEGLDASVDPGTGSLNTINQVASGNYQLGIADINSLIRYRDNAANVPIKAVMMVYDSPPFAILTLKKNNITKPKDLEGRTLGAPAADGAWAQFPILAKLNGIDMSKVRVDNVGFPVREALLAQGKVDAVTAFGSNALGLRANNIPQEEIVVLMMRRFGLDLYGSAIFAHPEFIKSQPRAVTGFNRALIRGFQDTVRDPEGAIDILMKHNPVGKRDVELARLKLVIEQSYVTPEVKANGFGGIDMQRLERSIDQLAIAFRYTHKPKAADIFTSEFLPPRAERLIQ
jgi:NitT/TauT family transport system substrate-binding protein